MTPTYLALLSALALCSGALAFAKAPSTSKSKLTAAQQDAEKMSNDPVGSTGKSCEEKCPHCGRKKHDTGDYPRDKSERRKALLRDAGPKSDLPQDARDFINESKGNNVPPGYEVSHNPPLYTRPKGERCKLDKQRYMKTMKRKDHRALHAPGGKQAKRYPRARYKF